MRIDRLVGPGERRTAVAQLVGHRHAGEPLDALGPVGADAVAGPPRSRSCARRRTPRRRAPRRRAMCSRPLASARSVPGSGCRCRSAPARRSAVRRGSTTMSRAPRSRPRVEVLHRRRHRLGGVAADQQDDVGLGDVGERERQPAVEPERPVRRRPRPRTCRSGRCSRCARCAARPGRTCRAGRPSRWSARRRRSSRRRRGRARPACGWIASTIRSSASSQVLDQRAGAVAGCADQRRGSRSGWSSSSVDDQPFGHSPPRLVGKSARHDGGGPVARGARPCRTAGSSTGSGSASSAPSAARAERAAARERRACPEGAWRAFPIDCPGVNAAFRRPHGVAPAR